MKITGKLARKFKEFFADDLSFFQQLIKEIMQEMKVKARRKKEGRYVPNYYQIQLPEAEFFLVDERLKLKVKKNIKSKIKQHNFKLYNQLRLNFDPTQEVERLVVDGEFKKISKEKKDEKTKDHGTKVFSAPKVEKRIEDSTSATINMGAMVLKNGYLKLKAGEEEKYFSLDSVETNIGRQESNEITLLDKSVSRVHAQIIDKKYYYLIRDLNSTNGVLVNGEFVQERQLADGDEIKLGEVRLKFIQEENHSC